MNLAEEVDLEDYVARPDKINNAEIASICQVGGRVWKGRWVGEWVDEWWVGVRAGGWAGGVGAENKATLWCRVRAACWRAAKQAGARWHVVLKCLLQ
jgi:hypothetical protein